ncbi:MAG TPA: glycosyltransferase family 4 protein [Kofleriaceae bacterium]|nr:glycosyltransferase family 4 protein [Kofleriaceae bacterium]
MTALDLALVVGAFVAALVGTFAYGRLAVRFGIVAVPNERSLHKVPVPRGGGVAIAVPFLAAMLILYALGELPLRWFLALFGGGAAIAVVGFIDDVIEVSARVRFTLHVALAALVLACLGGPPVVNLGFAVVDTGPLGIPLFALVVVWMINLYNFVDGIDGLAASGSVFICASGAALLVAARFEALGVPVAVLGAANLGFLVFNWPPARLFMGDTGSAFQGYLFSVFALISMKTDVLSGFTWTILMAYFVGDTTTTMILRIATVKRWWTTHRSHAYQNLARVWNNHRRMTLLVLAIDLAWLLPLALASVLWPRHAVWPTLLALLPPVFMAVRFGPLYDR